MRDYKPRQFHRPCEIDAGWTARESQLAQADERAVLFRDQRGGSGVVQAERHPAFEGGWREPGLKTRQRHCLGKFGCGLLVLRLGLPDDYAHDPE
jgi:hypothetical protein